MRQNPLTNVLVVSAFLLVIVGALFFLEFRTANVVLEYEEFYKIGDELETTVTITLNEKDRISENSPIIISLTKNRKVIEVKTMSLKEFLEESIVPPKVVEESGGVFYTGLRTHNVKVHEIIDYEFLEKGNYELFFNFPEKDLTIEKQILVE